MSFLQKIWISYYRCMILSPQTFWLELESDETIRMILPKHPIRFFFIVFLLVFWILLILFAVFYRSSVVAFFHPWIFWLVLTFFSVMYLTFLYFIFLSYILDIALITNKRVFFFDHTSVFSRRIRSFLISTITAVTAEKSGFLESVFDYGTIILTSINSKIILTHISHPLETVKHVDRIMQWTTQN